MLESLAPKARRSPSLVLAALLATLALLALGPGRAEASQVGPVAFEPCVPLDGGGCQYQPSVRVDLDFSVKASFNVTNAMGSGSSFFVEVSDGAQFLSTPSVQLNYKLGGYSTQGVSLSNGGRRVQVPVPSFLIQQEGSIAAGSKIELLIGANSGLMRPPAKPGLVTAQVWTTSDVDPRTSSSFETTIGLPASITSTGARAATVATEFTEAPEAKLTDARGNGIPGAELTFARSPAAGANGNFEGPQAQSTGETDADGLATPDLPLIANQTAGQWALGVSGPNSTTGSIAMHNLAGAADSIELEVDPTTLPADGSSAANATIRVRDQFDNLVTGDEIALDSADDGPTTEAPVLQEDGTYTATLNASTVPGEYAVTATDSSVEPALTDSVTVTQTELPATGIGLSLSPPSIAADGISTTTAIVRLENEIEGPVLGEEVTIASSGGNAVGPLTDHGDGTYTAVITSTTTAGPVTITATDKTAEPPLVRTAVLSQSALPPPPPPPPPGVPAVKIKSGPKGKTKAKRATFRFVTSSGSAAYFECKLDKRRWARCKSPKRYAVKPGRHTFSVRGIGGDGRPGPVAKRSFKRLPRR